MNPSNASTLSHGFKITFRATALFACVVFTPLGASGQAAGGDLQAKIAALKQSVAANQQKLHQYRWLETTQLTLNGNAKPAAEHVPVRPRRKSAKDSLMRPPQAHRPPAAADSNKESSKKKR